MDTMMIQVVTVEFGYALPLRSLSAVKMLTKNNYFFYCINLMIADITALILTDLTKA